MHLQELALDRELTFVVLKGAMSDEQGLKTGYISDGLHLNGAGSKHGRGCWPLIWLSGSGKRLAMRHKSIY